jgi:hypothetical protein
MNLLYYGDNLDILCAHIAAAGGDLIYSSTKGASTP